ncbi:spermatogenesis-associated protein 6 isoform X2 [Hydra vulgaris]|uniref:Spermatogenesis-associated protein 6 n=1 Tax=Hydra vulgaris TaxID=6087 RepID=T2M3Y3_HYDVU|nr:spermatogenesis-associated protein 6 isoform X2 [Hydra vulgaris]
MPRKAMKSIIEIDLHSITCPGTFLRQYEYVYLRIEMLGLEARTKSVPPTFPLFFREKLKFKKTFQDCTDPALVASLLKGDNVVIELIQQTDYISEGNVIAHCSSNTHDFLYPSIPPYYGSGREILLYKTSKFKPIRITGEPVKLEFSTKTIIKEVADSLLSLTTRRSSSPARALTRSASPKLTRSKSNGKLDKENSKSVESIPSRKLLRDYSLTPTIGSHYRSATAPQIYEPVYSPVKSLGYAFDDLNLYSNYRRRNLFSPNLNAALRSSTRIQRRIEDIIRKKDYSLDTDSDSDLTLDVLRETLREERKALNEAIKEADREAFYRSLNRTR